MKRMYTIEDIQEVIRHRRHLAGLAVDCHLYNTLDGDASGYDREQALKQHGQVQAYEWMLTNLEDALAQTR